MARGRLPGALAAGLELLGGGLLLAGEPLVVGGLALEALGLRAVLVGALEALLGLLPGLARAGGVGLELLAMAAGLGAQALAGALALDAAPGRGAVGEPCRDGDDGDDDDDDDGESRARTYPRAEATERIGSLRSVPPVTDLPLIASGKVREMYDLGDRHPDGRQRPDLDVRRRASDADPGQGRGPHRPVGLLVRTHRPHRHEPLRLGHRRTSPTTSAAAR